MKKIVIDCRELQGGMTGIGRFLHNFLVSLDTLDQENRYVLLLNKPTDLKVPGKNMIRHVLPESSTLLWDQIVLPRYLKDSKADLFFSPYYKLPLLSPCPSVITIHDIHFFNLPLYRDENGFFLNTYYQLAGKLFCRKANVILTVSEHSKQDIIRVYGVPSEKIQVVYNGVDLDRFRKLDAAEVQQRIKNHFPQVTGSYILYVGNAKPHKNIPFLIQGYASLPDDVRKSTQLVLVGVGNKKIFEKNNAIPESQLVILPAVDDHDLPFLYNAATIFVTASLYEGFCLPVAEAMACGTPVVASERGAIPEIASKGKGGCLFNPDNRDDFVVKLTSVLKNQAIRESMSQKGLVDVRHFSIETFAKKVHRTLMRTLQYETL